MFFADLSTGAHSPSIISQGRIGALVTAKPTDRRAVLEEAAGIAGLHVRRHEAELRLDAAENNLKRADELRRQQERQLQNLLKQAEEATKYKIISEDIKKIEAGLYYLKLKDIDNEIKVEKEINNEADNEVKGYNEKLELIEKNINEEIEKVNPIRDKNFEILSKIQRLNLELKGLDEENERIKSEIEEIKSSLKILENDTDREKSIIIDANSNEKRLKEEKQELIDIDSKYYETEKTSNEDLETAKNNLKIEQEKVDNLISNFGSENLKKNLQTIREIKNNIDEIIKLVKDNNNDEAIKILETCQITIGYLTQTINENDDDKKLSNLSEKNENIKKLQEIYADSYSKNENLKKDSIKRRERINTIENEINSWKSLLVNSEKKINELNERKKSLNQKLDELDKQPQTQAEKKGKISENLRISENEKKENEVLIDQIDNQINNYRNELNTTKESSIEIRERKASSSATIEGLDKRRNDLLDRVDAAVHLNEERL